MFSLILKNNKTEDYSIKTVRKSENFNREVFVDFLYKSLEEYGDDRNSIEESIDYALSDSSGKGGFIVCIKSVKTGKFLAGAVINRTGMKEYIPENILVYIAVDRHFRGKGLGKILLKKIISLCEGNIALHVEYDNPAKFLYKKMGFKSKYAEMRLEKKDL
ncbi:MAG: GNAT family N-acetyltransferase [Thermotogae bacterium]|nr:GNAT family N-acetyltransferase [Thermotogota bacterium]